MLEHGGRANEALERVVAHQGGIGVLVDVRVDADQQRDIGRLVSRGDLAEGGDEGVAVARLMVPAVAEQTLA